MKFSYSAVWADAMAILRSHGSLIATIAGVFIFLPVLLLTYFAPEPQAKSLDELFRVMGDYWGANWHWFLLQALIGMIGSIAILKLIFVLDITVGGAIAAGVALLPFYLLAALLGGVIIILGLCLLVVPGLYLIGRLFPLTVVVVAENRRNPIEAISRTFALTKGRGWAILGFILIVAIAAVIALGVASMLLGLLFVAVLGQELGTLMATIVAALVDAILTVLFIILNAAIYRNLGAEASPAGFAVPGAAAD